MVNYRKLYAETFEWDGLALIERSGTKYINEPHAGGGNPVLAVSENTETIFTDILGTSLGTVKEKQYSAIDKTSFGADSNDKSSFFTGKPYVEDLGYAFLLRNYRSDMGKWLSQDLIGYPDGWNNLAYCNNASTLVIDLYGAATAELRARSVNNSAGNAMHASMHLTVTSNEYEQLTLSQKTFFKKIDSGEYYAIVSGFESEGFVNLITRNTYLSIARNSETDTISKTINAGYLIIGSFEFNGQTHGKDLTVFDFVKNYLNATIKYETNQEKVDYDWFPNDLDEGNCNSLQNMLIKIAGGVFFLSPENINKNFPGLNHNMDNKFFE